MIPRTARHGVGPPLICHPGGPGFDGSELSDLGGLDRTRELVTIDPRGTGSTGPAASYDLADYVSDVEELRDQIGLQQFDFLGFSHGAIVAAVYAAAFPKRVRRLLLVNGLALFTDEMKEEADRLIALAAGKPWHRTAAAAIAREEAGAYETPEETAAMWNDMLPLYFSTWDERYRAAVEVDWLDPAPLRQFNASTLDITSELDRIEAETLVITGRDDFICGPAAADVLVAGIPRAKLVVIESAGHFTFLEQPQTFRDAAESFLARGD